MACNPSSRSCACLGKCPQWPARLSNLSAGFQKPVPGHVTLAVHGSLSAAAGAASWDIAPGLYSCQRALCRVVDVSRGSPDAPSSAPLINSETLDWYADGPWHAAVDAFLFTTSKAAARAHVSEQPQFVAHWDPIEDEDLHPPTPTDLYDNHRSWYGTPQWRINWDGELGHLPLVRPEAEGSRFCNDMPSSTNVYSETALRSPGAPWELRHALSVLAVLSHTRLCNGTAVLDASRAVRETGVPVVLVDTQGCPPTSLLGSTLFSELSSVAAAVPHCASIDDAAPSELLASDHSRVRMECLMHSFRYCMIRDPPSAAPGYLSLALYAALRSGCVPLYDGPLSPEEFERLLPSPIAGLHLGSDSTLGIIARELTDPAAYAMRTAWKKASHNEWSISFKNALTKNVVSAYCDVCDAVATTHNLHAMRSPRPHERVWVKPCLRDFYDKFSASVDRAHGGNVKRGWMADVGIDRAYVTHSQACE